MEIRMLLSGCPGQDCATEENLHDPQVGSVAIWGLQFEETPNNCRAFITILKKHGSGPLKFIIKLGILGADEQRQIIKE